MTSARELIVIAGAGRMGRGMAHAFAYTGNEVRLLDFKPRDADGTARARAETIGEVTRSLRTMASLGAITDAQADTMAARIEVLSGEAADAALAAADIVFEAVPEVMAMKQESFARICTHVRADVPIASTTSTFNVDDLAAFVVQPARFLNTHWLNPAFLIPLVEVSPAAATDPDVLARLLGLLRAAGKVAVECKAAPGFIIPRIQAIAMNEAARIVTEGVATAEAVDTATRVAFGIRFAVLGLLEFVDYGGGDILYYASDYLTRAFGDTRYAAPDIIVENMKAGRTGMRAGAGFYDWQSRDLTEYQRQTLAKLFDLLGHLKLLPSPS